MPWQFSLIQYELYCLFLFVASGPTCWAISQTPVPAQPHCGRPATSSELPSFFKINPSEGTMGDVQKRRDRSKTSGILESTSYIHVWKEQEEELKKRPVSVWAAATTHRFIDPSCRCVPLFCQCVSLNTYWALQKGILDKKGPKGLKLVSLPSNNKQTEIDHPPDVAGWSLSTAGRSRPAGCGPLFSFSNTQPNLKQCSWRRFSPTATQPFISHTLGSGHPHPLLHLASTAGEAAAGSGIDSPHSTWACCHRLYISLDLIHC